jgi:hypothetical protein
MDFHLTNADTINNSLMILRSPRVLSSKGVKTHTACMYSRTSAAERMLGEPGTNTERIKGVGFGTVISRQMCLYQDTTTCMVNVDDGILVDPNKEKIESALNDLFAVQDEGDLSDYLGVKVQKHPDGSIEFTQPQLIDSILEYL